MADVLVIKVAEDDLSLAEGLQVIRNIATAFNLTIRVHEESSDEGGEGRFWIMGTMDQQNMDDLELSAKSLVPIVDEDAGGIIAYAMPSHEDDIVDALKARPL